MCALRHFTNMLMFCVYLHHAFLFLLLFLTFRLGKNIIQTVFLTGSWCYVRCLEFVDQLRNCQMYSSDSAPYSQSISQLVMQFVLLVSQFYSLFCVFLFCFFCPFVYSLLVLELSNFKMVISHFLYIMQSGQNLSEFFISYEIYFSSFG